MSGRHSESEMLQIVGAAAFVVGLAGLAVFGLDFGTAETRVPTVLAVAVTAAVLVWVFLGRAN